MGTTNSRSFVNPSETSTEVPDLNVEMENDEYEEPKENRFLIQGTEGARISIEVVDRRTATPAPTNPSTSHRVDANVTGQRTSEKRKQHEVDQESQYMANALLGFAALYNKSEQLMMEQMKILKLS